MTVFEWIQLGNVQELTQLLETDPAVAQQRDKDNDQPLHKWCSISTDADVVLLVTRLLIDAHPEALHTKGSLGRLPLHVCSSYNTMAVVRVVLEANPDAAKQPNDGGNMPMHL